MAKGLNRVMLIGRLGKDPEVRHTQSGMSVANFTMATSESWTDKATNEKKERTEWHKIVAFNKLADICGQYLQKGRQIYVEGKIQSRSWDQDGETRYVTEINISDMQMLDSKDSSQGQQQSQRPIPPSQVNGYQGGKQELEYDSDIPF